MKNFTRWALAFATDNLSQLSAAIALVTAALMVSVVMTVRLEREVADSVSGTMIGWLALAAILIALDLVLTVKLKRSLADPTPDSTH